MAFNKDPNQGAAGNPNLKLVAFNKGDADRINAAVASFEQGPRTPVVSVLPRRGPSNAIRQATFFGAWGKGQTKTIRFSSDTSSTATATNLFCGVLPPSGLQITSGRQCLVSFSGTTGLILVNAEC